MEQKLPISSNQNGQLPEQLREACGLDLGFSGRKGRAIGILADVGRFVLHHEQDQRPRQKNQCRQHHERDVKAELFGERLDQKRAQRSHQADADIHDAHRLAAIQPEPMRNDQLMRDGPGEDVAQRVKHPKSVIDVKRAAHVGEPSEGEHGQDCADQNQLARAEAMDDDGAEPDGERRGQRKSESDVGARPVKLALEIVVEESDVVVRDAYREAEAEEGGGGDPPAKELAWHWVHCGTSYRPRMWNPPSTLITWPAE